MRSLVVGVLTLPARLVTQGVNAQHHCPSWRVVSGLRDCGAKRPWRCSPSPSRCWLAGAILVSSSPR
jgi:hypothetical protein